MKGHYLALVLDSGERVYVELEREDETAAEATERWVANHPSMVKRVRNRERKSNELMESIKSRRIARPTSYLREKAESEGRPWPEPVRRRSRRRRAA